MEFRPANRVSIYDNNGYYTWPENAVSGNIIRMKIILIALLSFVLVSLQGCADPDQPTISLYLASKRGDIDQIERHIFWKSDINQLNIDGQTPLHETARAGRVIAAKLLLENGAMLEKPNNEGQSVLFVALVNGRTQLAKMLIDQFQAKFDATESLFDIARNNVNDRDVVRFLVRRGAQPNSHDNDGLSPLLISVSNQQRLLSRHLIDNGSDVNFASASGQLPLDVANEVGNQDLVNLLLRNGARGSTAVSR